MEVGGVERSLLGLLNSFDYDKYSLDLFIHSHTGEFMSLIPNEVNLLPENKKYATFSKPIIRVIKEGFYAIAIARLLGKLRGFLYNLTHNSFDNISLYLYTTKYSSFFQPNFKKNGTYDLAISFIAPHNFVLDKITAKKKIAWIHSDYSYFSVDIKAEYPIWSKFDFIASISDDVTKTYLSKFPLLKDKIVLIENILSSKFIQEQASLIDVSVEMNRRKEELIFCSVGRFSKAKNFDNAVFICKNLVERGLKFKWYIIGYGKEESLIRQNINSANMENNFILLGKKTNPYPYMNRCDIYIQPSRYEGKAVTVREAQILSKPVVITDFPTASSQLKKDIDGIIVPMEINAASNEIFEFANNKKKQNDIILNLKLRDYGNRSEVEKIYQLMN